MLAKLIKRILGREYRKVIDLGDVYPRSADDFYCGLLKVGAGPPTMQLVYYMTPDGEIAF